MNDSSKNNNKDLSDQDIEIYFQQLRIGNWKNVLESLNILKDDYPNSSSICLLMAICHSVAMMENGDIEKPIIFFEKAKSLGLKNNDYNINIKEHYSRVGQYFRISNDYENAYKYLIKSTEYSNYNNHIYYSNIGSLLKIMDKTEESNEMYRKSIKINKNYAISYCNLGLNHYECKKFDDALEFFHKSTLIDDIQATYQIHYGNCFWALKRYEEGLKAYYKAHMLDPSNVDIFIIIAAALSTLERDNELQELVSSNLDDVNSNKNDKKSEQKIIKYSELLNILGQSYFKTKDFQKSINALSKAIEINPNNLIYYKNIINAYKMLGDTQKTKIYNDKLSKLSAQSKDND